MKSDVVKKMAVSKRILRAEFPKKPHSKRREIFVRRSLPTVVSLLREFHSRYDLEIEDRELQRIARDYLRQVASEMSNQKAELFSRDNYPERDFDTMVEVIRNRVES